MIMIKRLLYEPHNQVDADSEIHRFSAFIMSVSPSHCIRSLLCMKTKAQVGVAFQRLKTNTRSSGLCANYAPALYKAVTQSASKPLNYDS